ncbi:MAG: amino acid adenylation domain-containing protein [Pseudomonadota bacterium]
MARKDRIVEQATEIASDLSGYEEADIAPGATFLSLGFDSLFLTQFAAAIQKAFSVKTTFRQLMEETPTIDALAARLDSVMPTEAGEGVRDAQAGEASDGASPQVTPSVETPDVSSRIEVPAIPTSGAGDGAEDGLAAIFEAQLELMRQQLQALGGSFPSGARASSAPTRDSRKPGDAPAVSPPEKDHAAAARAAGAAPLSDEAPSASAGAALSDRQLRHIERLMERYVAKTSGSRDLTQHYRPAFADPRTAAGFTPLWKEMVYPIAVERSEGAHLWDVDGNKYIDLLNGFGPNFFGHRAPFVVETMRAQLEKGFEVGPQSPIAGEAAALFCELTGMARVSWVNTGSEAVQAAMRVARTVTGRDRVVCFAGSYHGNFDEVLVGRAPTREGRATRPSAPGVPMASTSNMIVLEYGADEALDVIARRADEIALVMVEPVQSRRPDFRPKEFLHALRKLTKAKGIVLLFDEVITGFRLGVDGAQGYFGVEADLATYGKVLAGGMPIGAVAGSPEFMDTFDGGQWRYGDASQPTAGVTFFAGTFVRHPMSIAAAHACLKYLKAAGPSLQQSVNAKTDRLAGALNDLFTERGVRFNLAHFASQMFLRTGGEGQLGDLFFYHLRERGVHILENFPSYMTAAHDDEDIDFVIDAARDSILEMEADEIFRPRGDAPSARRRRSYPLTAGQQEIWVASQLSDEASCAYNESISLRIEGELDEERFRVAVDASLDAHEAFRLRFTPDGETQWVDDEAQLRARLQDVSRLSEGERDACVTAFFEREASTPFDLENGPLARATLLRVGARESIFALYAHHIVFDGYATDLILRDIKSRYEDGAALASIKPFHVFANHANRPAARARCLEGWAAEFGDEAPAPLALPTDRPYAEKRRGAGATILKSFPLEVDAAAAALAREFGVGATAVYLAAFALVMSRLSGARRVVIGAPSAGQATSGVEAIGFCVSMWPLLIDLDGAEEFPELANRAQAALSAASDRPYVTASELARRLDAPFDPSRPPIVQVALNVTRFFEELNFGEAMTTPFENHRASAQYDVFVGVRKGADKLEIDCDYASDVFDAARVESWIDAFMQVVLVAAAKPASLLGDIADEAGAPDIAAETPLDVGTPLDEAAPSKKLASVSFDETTDANACGKVAATVLAAVERALGVSGVSLTDNYFDLGGQSLKAARLIADLRRALECEVRLAWLFDAPDLDAFVARIEASAPSVADIPQANDTIDDAREVGAVPLTFLQERFWAHAALDDGAGLHWLRLAWRIDGEVDDATLCAAVDDVVASHEILQMRIDSEAELPVFAPVATEMRTRTEVERTAATRMEGRLGDFWSPPSLEEGPLFKALVLRESDARATLAVLVHHTVWDGASSELFVNAVAERYAAQSQGRALEEKAACRLARQSEALTADRAAASDEDLAYWSNELAEPPEPYASPTDLPRPDLFDYAGDWIVRDLSAADLDAARRLAHAQKTTPFVVFLAAWAAFLSRLSEQDDLVIAAPTAMRENPVLSDVIGCYVTTAHFRARPNRNEPGRVLISKMRKTVMEGAGRCYAAPDEIAARLGVRRDPTRTPLTQTQFDWRETGVKAIGRGARIVEAPVNPRAAPCDLSLSVVDAGDGGRVELQYATSLFSERQAIAISDSFTAFLTAFLSEADAPLSRLPMMADKVRGEVLAFGTGLKRDTPAPGALDTIIAAASSAPDAVAIICEGRETTYAALLERSNDIAAALADAGAGDGAIIGVMARRGPDLVAACLAVWRIGGAYLPLDPTYPEERLRYMIDDSGAKAIIADEVADFDAIGGDDLLAKGAQFIALDGVERASSVIEPAAYDAARRAYVIYTSGSTGRPKGVENAHGQLANFLRSMARAPGLGRDDALLAVTTLSFDISILELFLPLAVGGRVVVASSEDAGDPYALEELLAEATVMQATPATWRLLIDAGWEGGAELRALCGGEALTETLAGDLVERVGELWNMYGPTETTVWSACKRITDPKNISIGRAIDDTRLYIRDSGGELRPPCAAGELWIGGRGVASGYLGRPDLTMERFQADPFQEEGAARVYRTGDLARWTPSGEIEILGRIDSQVKVRGFRIELEEIEAALDAISGISKGVAAVRPDAGGEPAIVAYVSYSDGARATGSELRRALRQSLPAYMLPQFFVELDAIPLTPNGKIDRKRLPDPAIGASTARDRAPPRSELERAIAEIWRELLPVEDVAVTDNFFELGGQSLQAARMAAIVRRRTGRRVSPRAAIFETLEQIARAAEAG